MVSPQQWKKSTKETASQRKPSFFGSLRSVVKKKNKTDTQRSGDADIHIQYSNYDLSASAEMRWIETVKLSWKYCPLFSLIVDLSNLY